MCVLGKALKQGFENICCMLVENESRLNDLDKASGDGDTGTTLRIGGAGESHLQSHHTTTLYTTPCCNGHFVHLY